LATCHTCLKVAPASEGRCPRCGARLHLRLTDSLHRTMALVATAAILYVPANVLVLLWHHGSYPIASVIFIASVLVPLGKLLVLTALCWSVRRGQLGRPRERTVLYRITELVGRWSMVDVFVVAILVALIQLGGVLRIEPGAAALAFCGVVIVTMIAAESFDPRLIWDKLGDEP
jgi:paraquat-inducible protein A